MREPTEIEQRHIDSCNEIINSDLFEVDHQVMEELGETLESAPGVFGVLPEWQDVILSPELHERTPRFNNLSCRWRMPGTSVELGGEFWLTDIFVALLRDPPDLALDDAPEEERRLYQEWRIIDSTPRAATGQMAAIRVQSRVDPLEIWYYDMNLADVDGWEDRQYVRMDVTYPQYLEALVLTKGTFGWQYLYADVSLRSDGFERTAEELKEMLKVFPQAFPNHDYSELARRLRERL